MSVENENRNYNNMMLNNSMNNNQDNLAPVALNNQWDMDNSCPAKDNCMSCEEKQCQREKMLKEIKCLGFAIIELALYLDTHPDDEKALCLHNQYCREYRELTDKYQKVYGPLTIHYPCNKWRWLEEPWPWEGGMN